MEPSESPRIAAIDIGTNSVLLVVAEPAPSGARAVLERATITRLGEGVDRTRQLLSAARERTLRCLAEYATELRAAGAERLDVVGTSALRDVHGGADFLDDAERVLGMRPRVIDGREEARLTFVGALSGLSLTGDVVVIDIGGGSTEFISGVAGGERRITWAESLDIGSVRLSERHVTNDPPSSSELVLVSADVRRALRSLPAPLPARATLVGVAGTITTLAAIDAACEPYEPERMHGVMLSRIAVTALCAKLAALSLAERRRLPGLEPARADVIVCGAYIAAEVMAWARADVLIVSDRGVRWGLVEAMLDTI